VTQTVGEEKERFQFSYPAAVVAMAVFAIFAWVAVALPEKDFGAFQPLPLNGPSGEPLREVAGDDESSRIFFGSTTAIGRTLLDSKGSFPGFALHYEVVGLVILVGVMGAVILGRRIGDEQEEEAKRRRAAKEAESSAGDAAEAHH